MVGLGLLLERVPVTLAYVLCGAWNIETIWHSHVKIVVITQPFYSLHLETWLHGGHLVSMSDYSSPLIVVYLLFHYFISCTVITSVWSQVAVHTLWYLEVRILHWDDLPQLSETFYCCQTRGQFVWSLKPTCSSTGSFCCCCWLFSARCNI